MPPFNSLLVNNSQVNNNITCCCRIDLMIGIHVPSEKDKGERKHKDLLILVSLGMRDIFF